MFKARLSFLAKRNLRFYATSTKDITLVVLEGEPVMTGKQQVLQRLGKMGYATIHLDFSQFAKTVEKEYTFENLSDEKKHTLFQNWVKYCENQFKNVSPTSVKADHLFVTASPIIPLLYMSEKMDTRLDQDAKTAIREWDKVFGKVRYFLSEADSIESAYRLSGDQYAFEHHINQYAPEKQQLAREVLERFNFVQMNRVFGGSAMINKSEKDIVEYCTARYRKLFAQYLNMHESAHSSVISQQATKDSDVKQMVKDCPANANMGYTSDVSPFVLHTTDAQQACFLLLKELGIEFKLPTTKPKKE